MSSLSRLDSAILCSRICIKYRLFNGGNWIWLVLLICSSLGFEIASISLMDILGGFYTTLTENDKEGFLRVLYKALLVVTLISILYSIQQWASEACALQWRERLVNTLQVLYMRDPRSNSNNKCNKDAN